MYFAHPSTSEFTKTGKLTPEEEFALTFGYTLPNTTSIAADVDEDKPTWYPPAPEPVLRPRLTSRRHTIFQDDFAEEGGLVDLPAPPLCAYASLQSLHVLISHSASGFLLAEYASICLAHPIASSRSSVNLYCCRFKTRKACL